MMASKFYCQMLSHGLIKDVSLDMYPSILSGHAPDLAAALSATQSALGKDIESVFSEEWTHAFGVVTKGEIQIHRKGLPNFTLISGMYFSCPGALRVSGAGRAAIFQRRGYRGLFEIGGPIETEGRLCYIDNCMSTLLAPPPRKGDPCLNLLTFPAKTVQTMHIHPTMRLGVVLSGTGICLLGDGQKIPLKPETAFYIGQSTAHCFHSNEAMSIIAYHPDTDVGPTDELHPMLSRTYTDY